MEKQMAKYFKEKPEYKRLLNGIKNKYINLREIKGNIDKNYKLPKKYATNYRKILKNNSINAII